MRQIRFIIGLMIVVIEYSCKSKNAPPDLNLITDLINETIKQDSLKESVPINIKLIDYYLYFAPIVSKTDSVAPPPPPRYSNANGEAPFEIDSYKQELKYVLNYSLSKEDSMFIVNQITQYKNLRIDSNRIDRRFKVKNFSRLHFRDNWKDEIYFFKVPILNKELNIAIIDYDYFCVSCGHGRLVILKKMNNKWIIVQSKTTWIN